MCNSLDVIEAKHGWNRCFLLGLLLKFVSLPFREAFIALPSQSSRLIIITFSEIMLDPSLPAFLFFPESILNQLLFTF